MTSEQELDLEVQLLQAQLQQLQEEIAHVKTAQNKLNDATNKIKQQELAYHSQHLIIVEHHKAAMLSNNAVLDELKNVKQQTNSIFANTKLKEAEINCTQKQISIDQTKSYKLKIQTANREIENYQKILDQLEQFKNVYESAVAQYDLQNGDSEQLGELFQTLAKQDDEILDLNYEMIEMNYRHKEYLTQEKQTLTEGNTKLKLDANAMQDKIDVNESVEKELKAYLNENQQHQQNQTLELAVLRKIYLFQIDFEMLRDVYTQIGDAQVKLAQDLLIEKVAAKGDLQYAQAKITNYGTNIQNANVNIPNIVKRTQELQAKIYQSKIEFNQAEKDYETCQDKLNLKAGELADLKGDKSSQMDQLEEQLAKRVVVQDKLLLEKTAIEQSYNSEMTICKSKNVELKLKCQELSEKVQTIKNEVVSVRNSKIKFEQMVQTTSSKHQVLQSYVKELLSKIKDCQFQIINLKDQRIQFLTDQLRQHLDDSEREKFIDQQIALLNDKFKQMQEEVLEYQKSDQQLKLIESNVSNLEQENQKVRQMQEEEKKQFELQLNDVDAQKTTIEQVLAEQIAQNIKLQSELGQLVEQSKMQLNTNAIDIINEYQTVFQQLQDLQNSKSQEQLDVEQFEQQLLDLFVQQLNRVTELSNAADIKQEEQLQQIRAIQQSGTEIQNQQLLDQKQHNESDKQQRIKINQELKMQQSLQLQSIQNLTQLEIELSAAVKQLKFDLSQLRRQRQDQLNSEINLIPSDFDLDSAILQKRTSERQNSRSNSNNDEGEKSDLPEAKIIADNLERKFNYEMTQALELIKEQSERDDSEIGSEVDLGRSGSVYRPSIFDMKRKTNQQGTYRSTILDKNPLANKIGMAILKKIKIQKQEEDVVLGDLLTCLLSQIPMLDLQSDLELMQGYKLFEKLYNSDPRCHEAMFGLARINYIQGRYELAEKLLIKAYETKRDFAYRVWLGFTQMQLSIVCIDQNPKKIQSAKNAFQNLDRCTKERKVQLYANFGLVYLSLLVAEKGWQIKGCQDPMYYAKLVQENGKYEGTVATAVVNLNQGSAAVGVKQLEELISEQIERPQAHFALISYFLKAKEFQNARKAVEVASINMIEFDNFQERLALTFLLCKALLKDNQPESALLVLQMQYTESPHFNSLLFVYGKAIVKTKSLHKNYLVAGISALQEIKIISCQVRTAQACYWLSQAYSLQQNLTQQGLNQYQYLDTIIQVVKSGPVKLKPLKQPIVDVSAQQQILKAIQDQKFQMVQELQQDNNLLLSPTAVLNGQSQVEEYHKIKDLNQACLKISAQRDQQLYRALVLYRIQDDLKQADSLFQSLQKQYPQDIEIQIENVIFLRYCLKRNFKLKREVDQQSEAALLVNLLKKQLVNSDLWARALIESAKLFNEITLREPANQLQLKAFECLLQMKQVLPVIDANLAAVKLPGSTDRYLSEEFDHIDFQAEAPLVPEQQVNVDDSEFKPQNEIDESNRFFIQTMFAKIRLEKCPLATLSIAEIKDSERVKGDQVFFFGAAQTELAYFAQDVNKQEPLSQYYKSSTPLIAVIKFLDHLRQVKDSKLEPELVRDFGFCVRSDPEFLYQIAKICYKNQMFIDLAIQSLHLYQQMVSYYQNFLDYSHKLLKAKLLLALILKRISAEQQDISVIESIVSDIGPGLKKAYDLAVYLPSNKQTQEEYETKRCYKLLEALMQ